MRLRPPKRSSSSPPRWRRALKKGRILGPNDTGRPRGVVSAGALLLTLLGTWLWITMLMGPYRLVDGMLQARGHLRRAQNTLTSGDLPTARFATYSAAAETRRARAALDQGGPLFDIARTVPRVDRIMKEVPKLVLAAEHSSEAALTTLEIAENALRGPNAIIAEDPQDPKGSVVRIERLEEVGAQMGSVRRSVKATADALRSVDPAPLPRRLRASIEEGLRQAEDAEVALEDAEAGVSLLPGFFGKDGPRRYLIGMQNSAELRGTGGSILQFAVLEIDDGRPSIGRGDAASASVYDIDRNREPLTISLPNDAWYVQGIDDAKRFGNANWSPDWPLSANLTIEYGKASAERYGVDFPEVDGVILVDPSSMAALMPGVGPFRTEESRNKITAGRTIYFLLNKAYAAFPRNDYRRKVLQQVVDGFFDRLLNPQHPTLLLQGFGSSLSQKHLQIWMSDPAEQAFVEHMDWDAALREAEGSDYHLLVEQNVGGNKLDYFAEQKDTLEIAFDGADSLVSASTELRNGVFLPQPRYALGDANSLFRPMMNFYAPLEAIRQGVSAPDACGPNPSEVFIVCRLDTPPPGIWMNGQPAEHVELGKRVWSATLQIPPGMSGKVAFRYRVPNVVETRGRRRIYRLVLQHQPKVRPQEMEVQIELPAGADSVRAPGFKRDGAILVWERSLKKDVVLEVSWEE